MLLGVASTARVSTGVDVVALIGDVLVFLALVAALVTVMYARDTAKVMHGMAKDLAKTAATMKANLLLANRGRQEDRLLHRLEQYERVMHGIEKMAEGQRRRDASMPELYLQEARAELLTALSVLPETGLSACRRFADGTFVPANLDSARTEISKAVRDVHEQLAKFDSPLS
jgi:hypothetical protein